MQSQDSSTDCARYILQVYVGALSTHYEALSVEASKQTTAEEIVSCIVDRLGLPGANYELAEVAGECKERRLSPDEKPVSVMLLWPMHLERDFHRFYLRESQLDMAWLNSYGLEDPHLLRDFIPFLYQPENREYPDLCQLPDLNESTLLENLRQRFETGHIYTYVGSILIAVNPFKFHPIYNPKYVRLYQNQRAGPTLPPHIFAIADNAYYCMLKERRNQCVVISGESGSGKTESTNFLLHHLTALSQKGSHGSGVEQTILSAGPVLEAFGNAKTAHNNNSSRFGKFIQVNYRENGMVQGAVVQKYLLEKSRIVSQGPFERNYHVFYYLLSGATDIEREALHLLTSDKYCYLNAKNLILENCDEIYEFSRLKQSMEMVGFSSEKQRRLFNVLSAVLLLGNVEFFPKKSTYHHDESVQVRNPDVVSIISELLKVKQDTLLAALTSKRVKASGETLIMQYKLPEAIAARDALAKCLYGALFDWIVLQVNHALLNKDQTPHIGHSIGVLDIFGFEDFGSLNSFEQLCINYANEHLQYYFNLHVFKYEQNEYKREGIKWRDIEFMDNSGCLQLFESKPTGLLCILDDLCSFPGATNESLLQKYNTVHKENQFYEKPQRKENAFIIKHYAGKVKYQVTDMREKNLDLMRTDIVSVLKNSSMAFVRELVGADPVAVFRWAILRAFFRGYFAFRNAGIKHRKERNDQVYNKVPGKSRFRAHNDLIVSKRINTTETTPMLIPTSSSTSISSSYTQQQQQNYLNKNPRRSWSSIAFNNKNFPDGKLGYESNNNNLGIVINDDDSAGKIKLFSKGNTKFERSSQEVMARASQIVQKNKSFRPRERPKKGLKNLQSVKTLTAGQNYTNNQTAVKTRKLPLTVAAQFQNSLIALMETLNQANPFFIRCIKSNPHKNPNKFDDATVIRQLRYTGMLETVRIRRAGYNVRLTYEEFIQLYRILLPKALLSSQKDVRDFMNTMDLNKQHYQLGTTKIYMRESQKSRLDVKLHTRIIDSIVRIQRWFRSILLRKKYQILRNSAVKIQSYWRMFMSQKQTNNHNIQVQAAILIQSTWKSYVTRKWFNKLKCGIIQVQAHSRGKLARVRYKATIRQKYLKERSKLRPTQSLPVNERSIDIPFYNVSKTPLMKPQHSSVDSDNPVTKISDYNQYNNTNYYNNLTTPMKQSQLLELTDEHLLGYHHPLTKTSEQEKRDVLNKAETQFRSLMITGNNNNKKTNDDDKLMQNEYENVDRKDRVYDLEHVTKSYFDDIETLKRFDTTKVPVRRVDSGPAPLRREIRFNNSGEISIGPLRSTASNIMPNTNVDIVLVNTPPIIDETLMSKLQQRNVQRTVQTQQPQQQLHCNKFSRRDVVCRSTGDEINTNYDIINYQSKSPQSINSSQFSTPTNSNQTSPYNILQQPLTPNLHQQSKELIDKGFFSVPSKVDKAAAILGTITEDHQKHIRDEQHQFTTARTRRVKTNLSDEFSTHPNPLQSRRCGIPNDTLRRRNSDPTNKIPLLEVNRGNDMYQSSTHINIAGHRFRKAARIGKAEKCASCQESDAFVNEGYRCLDCKLLVHTKCIQNGGVKTLQCEAKRSKRLRQKNTDKVDKGIIQNSKYSGTREYTDSTDKIISDAKELQNMQDFITKKIMKMEHDCENPSEVDRVFKQALREFKDNLVAQYSVAHKQNSDGLNIKYRDLISNFEHVMETCCGRKDDFPLTMGVNAFRGFMNEFMNSREADKPKAKRKKDKRRKIEEHTSYNGHTFQLTIINIATACEICQLFLLWPIERGLVCQNCRLTCHKKCYQKSNTCNKISTQHGNQSSIHNILIDSKLFGIPLTNLCITDGTKIPIQIDQLITKIEMHGLYAEGIYRKSGVSSKIKELKLKMSEPSEIPIEIDYESYNVHVLANVLKSFLRDMPEPLLTFDRYDDFLRASDLSDTQDRVLTILSLIKKIPPSHHALLERLIFHLALVAQREQYNRMSASSLAIVFAPCVLRTNRSIPAQDSLNDIGRQTKCIETLITQKMLNVKSTLADIDTLDTAAHTATTRLSTLRSSKVFTPEELAPRQTNMETDTEERILEGHIQEIKKEKALLTSTLPSLARASSDDDLLSTDLDGEGSLDDLSVREKDCQSMTDSRDSAVGSFGDNISRRTMDLGDVTYSLSKDNSNSSNLYLYNDSGIIDSVGLSYNLRDQNIDYIPSPRSQTSLDKEIFLKSSYISNSSSSSSSTITKPIATGHSSKWSGSQQNLSHPTTTIISGTILTNSGSELQRQKPIVMRSISGGYDTTTITQQNTGTLTGVGISSSSSNNSKDSKDNNNRKTKRQNSLDDEPIMV